MGQKLSRVFQHALIIFFLLTASIQAPNLAAHLLIRRDLLCVSVLCFKLISSQEKHPQTCQRWMMETSDAPEWVCYMGILPFLIYSEV